LQDPREPDASLHLRVGVVMESEHGLPGEDFCIGLFDPDRRQDLVTLLADDGVVERLPVQAGKRFVALLDAAL
jgi:hypothetical protein